MREVLISRTLASQNLAGQGRSVGVRVNRHVFGKPLPHARIARSFTTKNIEWPLDFEGESYEELGLNIRFLYAARRPDALPDYISAASLFLISVNEDLWQLVADDKNGETYYQLLGVPSGKYVFRSKEDDSSTLVEVVQESLFRKATVFSRHVDESADYRLENLAALRAIMSHRYGDGTQLNLVVLHIAQLQANRNRGPSISATDDSKCCNKYCQPIASGPGCECRLCTRCKGLNRKWTCGP